MSKELRFTIKGEDLEHLYEICDSLGLEPKQVVMKGLQIMSLYSSSGGLAKLLLKTEEQEQEILVV